MALKVAIQDFFSSLSSELSPSRTLKWPVCVVRKSRATHRALFTCNVVRHMARRDGSAIKFDRVKIAFSLALCYYLKPFIDEGGEETGVLGENPRRRASENAIY